MHVQVEYLQLEMLWLPIRIPRAESANVQILHSRVKDYSAQIKQEALSNEVSMGRESKVNGSVDCLSDFL